jgi:hypothetical protein
LIVGEKLVERNGQVVMMRRYSDQLLIVARRREVVSRNALVVYRISVSQ